MTRPKKRELRRFQQYFTCLADRRRDAAETAVVANDDRPAPAKAS